MGELEYISVLLSIIIGLGITHLLAGIARLLRDGRALAPGWWVLLVVATLLLAQFQVWWAAFGWRNISNWTFQSYFAFMILPMLLYLLSFMVLPAEREASGRELVDGFIRRRRAIFTLIALIPLASYLQQWLLSGTLNVDLDAVIRFSWLALAVPGFVSRRVAVQATLATIYFALFVAYVVLLFLRMQ